MPKNSVKAAGFFIPPVLASISPLLVIPAITARFGADGWSQIAVAQSVGLGASVLVDLGWSLTGAQRVGRASMRYRRHLYTRALWSRGVMMLPAGVVASIAAWLLCDGDVIVSVGTALAAAGAGLSSAWFFIGMGSPRDLLIYDSAPRMLLSVLAGVLLLCHSSLVTYPLCMLAGCVIPHIMYMCQEKFTVRDLWYGTRRTRLVVRYQLPSLVSRASNALYLALPVSIVSIFAPASVPQFAAVERLLRMGTSVLVAVPNIFQAWVGKAVSKLERERRVRIAVGISVLTAPAYAVGFCLAAPAISRYVFTGVVDIPYSLSLASGMVLAVSVMNKVTGGVGLVATRQIGHIARSMMLGGLLGCAAICVLSWLFGAIGAATGELVAESSVLLYQSYVLRRLLVSRNASMRLLRLARRTALRWEVSR